jgi:hypothetical protein
VRAEFYAEAAVLRGIVADQTTQMEALKKHADELDSATHAAQAQVQ